MDKENRLSPPQSLTSMSRRDVEGIPRANAGVTSVLSNKLSFWSYLSTRKDGQLMVTTHQNVCSQFTLWIPDY